MIFWSLLNSGVGRIGFSQQFDTKNDISSKVIYVQGGLLSSFVFKFTSTRFELKDDFSSLDVRMCPESVMKHVHATMLPPTSFQTFHIGRYMGKKTAFLQRSRSTSMLQRVGHFSWEQVDLLEN